jgi:hypothetical protein
VIIGLIRRQIDFGFLRIGAHFSAAPELYRQRRVSNHQTNRNPLCSGDF